MESIGKMCITHLENVYIGYKGVLKPKKKKKKKFNVY